MIRVLIVGLLGSVGGSGVGPYCKLINGTLGQNAQSLVTITSGDAINSVSSTVSLTTIADCCTACDNWLGFKPCAGFLFDPVEQICFLKAKLGVVLEDALSKTVVGFPAKQKYTLELVGQSPTEFVALKQISAVNTDKECCWHCLVMAECRSFKFNQTETNCQLGDVTTTDYQINIATDSANDFYQIDHNIEKQDTRKSRFLIIGGTNSSWNQDFTDEILQFIPEDRTLTAVGSSLLRRRNHISVLYKDRLINDGGILEYGTSNFFSAEFSQTEISLSADEPLSLVNLTKPFEASNLGCGGIIAQDYYYTCFGHSIPNQCHIYNLREGQNYTKVATVNMTEPARQRSTCVQIGSILYIIGGKRVSSNVTLNGETLTSVYQYNFDSALLYSAAAVLHKDTIIVCGGQPITNECYEYKPRLDVWHPFANMVKARRRHKMVPWGYNKLLAFYGRGSGSDLEPSIEVYEPTTGWRVLLAQTPRPIYNYQLVPLQ